MKPLPCASCGYEEIIPTSQHVKFDGAVYYLCSDCWEEFRRWFNQGRMRRRSGQGFIR